MLRWGEGWTLWRRSSFCSSYRRFNLDAINQLYLNKVGFTTIDSSSSTNITVSKNVDDIQTEIGTETLSTTSQTLIGAINEINGGLSSLFSEFAVEDLNGRVKLSNSLVIQWEKTAWLNDATYDTITFPISFSFIPTVFITSWKLSQQALATGSVYNVSTSEFSIYHCGANSSEGSYYSWLAIGRAWGERRRG